MARMRYTKMHGCGNAYVLVDCRNGLVEGMTDPGRIAVRVCDRDKGVDADGLILVQPSNAGDVRMEMYNADGSRGSMCGNGIRCVGKFVIEADAGGSSRVKSGPAAVRGLDVETDVGMRHLYCFLQDGEVGHVAVDMGCASLRLADMNCTLAGETAVDRPVAIGNQTHLLTCVSVGNLHAVLFVEDVAAVPLRKLGRAIEHAPIFPDRVNVHFVEVVARDALRMRPWERGSGATQACGTGACAAVAASVTTGRADHTCRVDQPGGTVLIHLGQTVLLAGPAETVCQGDLCLANDE